MTEWLLIIVLYKGGISTTKLPDKASCERAAKVAEKLETRLDYHLRTGCVEVSKSI
jgi:hypothetical protein